MKSCDAVAQGKSGGSDVVGPAGQGELADTVVVQDWNVPGHFTVAA